MASLWGQLSPGPPLRAPSTQAVTSSVTLLSRPRPVPQSRPLGRAARPRGPLSSSVMRWLSCLSPWDTVCIRLPPGGWSDPDAELSPAGDAADVLSPPLPPSGLSGRSPAPTLAPSAPSATRMVRHTRPRLWEAQNLRGSWVTNAGLCDDSSATGPPSRWTCVGWAARLLEPGALCTVRCGPEGLGPSKERRANLPEGSVATLSVCDRRLSHTAKETNSHPRGLTRGPLPALGTCPVPLTRALPPGGRGRSRLQTGPLSPAHHSPRHPLSPSPCRSPGSPAHPPWCWGAGIPEGLTSIWSCKQTMFQTAQLNQSWRPARGTLLPRGVSGEGPRRAPAAGSPAHLQAQGQVLRAPAGQLVLILVLILQAQVGRDDALGVLLGDLHEVVQRYVALG